MSESRRKAQSKAAAEAERLGEMQKLYAQVAAHQAGRQVLGDILSKLADPDFPCEGIAHRGDAFLARYREASRIQNMIAAGQGR